MVGWFRFKTLLLDLGKKRKQLSATYSGLGKKQLDERLQEERQTVKPKAARGPLSVEEFDKADMVIVCFCQRKRFSAEIASRQKWGSVKRTSHLYRL